VFIRLAGCPLRCVYCDTKYSWDFEGGVDMGVEEIVAKAASLGVRGHVVMTGGEPLIWLRRGLEELACRLRELGTVEVETSGVYRPTPRLDACVYFNDVSPKLSNAGIKAPLDEFYVSSPKAWFKFVVATWGMWRRSCAMWRHTASRGTGSSSCPCLKPLRNTLRFSAGYGTPL
jgi:7-carboxy-7-deazaguanine synthase